MTDWVTRLADLSPEKRRLLELRLRQSATLAAHDQPRARPRPFHEAPPLTVAQERIWFLEQLLPGSPVHNSPVRIRLRGGVDPDALRSALEITVGRHEALRTRYRDQDGFPVQEIQSPMPFHLPVIALADELEASAWLDAENSVPFDLIHGPLIRATLLRLGNHDQILAINAHQSVVDGWSWGVILREVFAAYDALARGEQPDLPPVQLQYADYAVWQRSRMSEEGLDPQLAYWRRILNGAPRVLELPTDRSRRPGYGHSGARHSFVVSKDVSGRLRDLAWMENATLFMVLLAAFQALLSRWSGQRDVVVGTPVAGRIFPETEGMVGLVANMLPLRSNLSGRPTFRELLAQVHEVTIGAFEHQTLPFERLLDELRVERSLNHEPVFQVSFSLREAPLANFLPGNVRAEAVTPGRTFARYDFALHVLERDGRLEGTFEYDAELFEAATVARLSDRFERLLDLVVANPDANPLEADLLTASERKTLDRWSRGSETPAPSLVPLPVRFERVTAAQPRAPAIRFDGRTFTYAELDARANRIARRLRALGAGPEACVGVCLERTPDAVAALLGVMKTGAAYVPLDPRYPPERSAFMIQDVHALAVVTTSRFSDSLPVGAALLLLDVQAEEIGRESPDALGIDISSSSLAYILYTSGSTGTPKGVMVEHGSLSVLLTALDAIMPEEDRQGVLASTSFAFDVSLAEVFGTLCGGGMLILVENALDLAHLPSVEDVRMAVMSPSAAAELVRVGGIPPSVRALNLGGEPLTGVLVEQLYETCEVRAVRNLYGPTEATVYATWAEARPGDRHPSIGRPMLRRRAYVLDPALTPTPIGFPGELFLGGAGVARGYAGRPGITAERFVPDPFSDAPGARMYRTGDRVRWRPNGELEYLGRLDAQVKVRGFRIELGEVESVLLSHPTVRDAVVAVHHGEKDSPRLVAYMVPVAEDAALPAWEIRAFLRHRLPEYMVPSEFVTIDAIPLTPNGKVDRKALPSPDVTSRGFVAPSTRTERAVADIWASILGVERVGVEDSFFDLGGHSLLAVRVIALVAARFGVELPLSVFFESSSLRTFAAELDAAVQAYASDEWRDDGLAGLLEAASRPTGPEVPGVPASGPTSSRAAAPRARGLSSGEPSGTGSEHASETRKIHVWIEPAAEPPAVRMAVSIGPNPLARDEALPPPEWGEHERLDLLIRVSGSMLDFEPRSRRVRLEQRKPLEPVFFTVTPRATGELTAYVQVFWVDEMLFLQEIEAALYVPDRGEAA